MNPRVFGLLFLAVANIPARAVVISQWTFETPNTPPDALNSAAQTGMVPASANGTASGIHVSALTDWSTPAGSGASAESWSANNWANGDYWEFQLSTTGFDSIMLNWDQRSSATGPLDFGVFYSSDGSVFTQFGANHVLGSSFTSFSHDLSAVTSLDDDSSIFFRLLVMSGTGVNGSPIGTAGTSAIDNFTVSGTTIPDGSPVPDGSPGLVGFAGVLALLAIGRLHFRCQQIC